jgi:hypothetical protein
MEGGGQQVPLLREGGGGDAVAVQAAQGEGPRRAWRLGVSDLQPARAQPAGPARPGPSGDAECAVGAAMTRIRLSLFLSLSRERERVMTRIRRVDSDVAAAVGPMDASQPP